VATLTILSFTKSGAALSILNIETARVFSPLLDPARDKGAHGGRGSGKSHFFAEKLIDDSLYERGLLSVCIREVQKSLKDSAKRLIESKLIKFKLGEADGFKVYNELIKTPGDGVILFQGMQDHTAESIKSLEGFKRAWTEEAQSLSSRSLTLLRPTIRASGSEMWWSWNPRHKTDPVDVMLRGAEKPTGAVVVEANWRDNPWLTDELEQERLDCLRMKPDQYDHIWEGGYSRVTEGAYYAKQLAEARAAGRIGRVAPDPLMTYRAIWDIGGTGSKADAVSIWIVQFIGREIRWLNYYEAQGQPLAAHVNWLRSNGYGNALCILPHDGASNDKVYDVSYESALRQTEFEVIVVPNQGKGAALQRVEAARRLFPNMYFNEVTCEAGLDALGSYHERQDETRGIGLGPEHDWASHGADSFGLGAVAYEAPQEARKKRLRPRFSEEAGWMNR
jgi:phage terminase large subunit